MNLWLYTGLVAAAVTVALALLTGLGLLLLRAAGLRTNETGAWLAAPWLGWAVCILALQVWHMWLPVDGRALALLATMGAAGLLLHVRVLRSALGTLRWVGFALVTVLVALWVALHTTRQPQLDDNGLYHLSAIRWAYSYPIVHGLGNLHSRLAFNNSFFLYAALLNTGPFVGRAHHLAGGIFFTLAIVRSLAGWRRLLSSRGDAPAHRIFDALTLVPLLVYTMGDYGPSPTPDVAVYVLGLIVGSELLRLLEARIGPERDYTHGQAASTGLAVLVLAVCGLTIKLSFAAVALASSALVVVAGKGVAWPRVRRSVLAAGAVGLLLIVPWMIRGVILSGYPAYPATFGAFPVEWRMPEATARLESDWIRSWARQPGAQPAEVLKGWKWLWSWFNDFQRNGFGVITPLALAILVAPAVRLLGRRPSAPSAGRSRLWIFLIVPVAGLAYWVLMAPEYRFAGATFWMLGLGSMAIALAGSDPAPARIITFSLTVVLFAQSVNPVDFVHPWHRNVAPARRGDVVRVRTLSGLGVYVSREGQQCWDAPLPCTWRLDPRLRLRVPGDLGSGFVLGPGSEPPPPAVVR